MRCPQLLIQTPTQSRVCRVTPAREGTGYTACSRRDPLEFPVLSPEAKIQKDPHDL